MGTTSAIFGSKEDFIKDITKDQENEKYTWKVIKKSVKSNIVWCLYEIYNKKTTEVKYDIVCYKYGVIKLFHGNNEYYWKDFSYSMHPHYYNCPLSYLNYVSFNTESERTWKAEVERLHNEKKTKVKKEVGQIWTIKGATIKGTVKLIEKVKNSFYVIHLESGKGYRMTPKFFGELVK